MKVLIKFLSIFFVLTGFALSSQPLQAQSEGIEFFHGSWEEVLAEAKKEKKLIFVDAYTTWCGPCKMMARNTFTNSAVGRFHNKNFINYKFDMEKGEGPTFGAKYGVRAYPTIFYINYKGESVHQAVGYKAPDALLAESEKAMDPSKNSANMDLKYKAGELESDKLFAYAMKLKKDGEDYREPANEYFSSLSNKQFCSKSGWEAIKELSTDVNSPEFQLLLKKQKKFNKIANPVDVEATISSVFKKNVLRAALADDDAAYQQLLEVAATKVKDKGKTEARMKMTYAEAKKNWDLYARSAIDFFDNYTSTDADELNEAAWNFSQQVEKEAYLKKAVSWSRQSVALKNQYYNNDTYALLLYQTGNYKEAFKIANKAVSIAQDNYEDFGRTEELLKKIREEMN